jgi:hypothetical protein
MQLSGMMRGPTALRPVGGAVLPEGHAGAVESPAVLALFPYDTSVMNPLHALRTFLAAALLAYLAGCANYGLGYSYPGFGGGFGYPGFGYGYSPFGFGPYGYGYPYGGYGYGPYYQYGNGGGGHHYRNTQLWSAYQWLRSNPSGTQLTPGQQRWLRHHR